MKKIDYSKIKALSSQILECIGDYSEGEDPSLPKQDDDINDNGQSTQIEFLSADKASPTEGEEISPAEDETDGKKKKRKDSAMAMMSSILASKFGK